MTTQIVSYPSERDVSVAVGTLKMLADETRLRLIWALVHGEHSVNELAEHVGVSATGVSQHLAKLRLSQLVETRREGTKIFYWVADDHVRRLVEESLGHADHVEDDREMSEPGERRVRA
jgi:DNA-binding transcriptional ArsR family regulator